MNATTRFTLASIVAAVLLSAASHGLRADNPDAPAAPPRSKNAWTLEEALKELKLNPRDTYLQYVALQLARREGRLEEVAGTVEKLSGGNADGSAGRAAQADLFSMFAGALAVQEGLQLDTMRGRPTGQPRKSVEVVVAAQVPAPTAGGVVSGSTLTGELSGAAVNPPAGSLLCGPPPCVPCAPAAAFGEAIPAPLDYSSCEPLPLPEADAEESEEMPTREEDRSGDPPPMPPADTEGPPPMPEVEKDSPPARNETASAAETPKEISGNVKCVPVSETHYKDCTYTVYNKATGKTETVTKKVPYTVCRMAPVNEVTTSADEDTTIPKVRVTGVYAVKSKAPLPTEEIKWEPIPGPRVRLSQLEGPQVKSHPWAEMLAGRDPEVSTLSRCVPHDFYLVEFRSVAKLLDVLDSADQWSTFIYSQSVKDARSQRVGERVRAQLALEVDPLSRPFYDLVLDGLAITGSDLFVREGSDVTLLMLFRQEKLFKGQMERFLVNAAKSRPDAQRTTGTMLGVPYVHLATPDRDLCVFAAYPRPGLHVRSNSKVALRRVLEALRGTDSAGNAVKRLGETDEYRYLRTLMPRGAKEEDGFVYLSDAFIRHMVSPQLKLTERRRLVAYNHLRMIGHAAQLYRTEQGKAPASLDDLTEADCCPGQFNEGELKAPDGGRYTLSADGTSGRCTRHGTVRFLTPCCEIPVKGCVTHEEATAYQAFVEQYNQYWRTYFDPIAIRVQVQPKRVRFETIVLPLIDNTVYTVLAKFLGGEPEYLDSLPVPKRNIFSMNVRLNKEELLKELLGQDPTEKPNDPAGSVAFQPKQTLEQADLEAFLCGEDKASKAEMRESLTQLLRKGLGNQVGLQVYDQGVPFDLNLATFLGQMMGSFNGNGTDTTALGANLGVMAIAVPVAACTAPGYLSITVKNEKIVDDFLEQLDKVIPALKSEVQGALGPTLGIEGDYYKLTLKGGVTARSFTLRVGPARFRVHCARIGKGLYLTNHASVLEDIQEATHKVSAKPVAGWAYSLEFAQPLQPSHGADYKPDLGPKAHAMVRMRARNWNQALPGFRLSWAENNRQSCHCNLGPLSGIARALSATPPGDGAKTASWDDRLVQDYAARVYGSYHVCPDGGRYVLAADGKRVVCTVHGSLQEPRQGMAPADNSPTARLMREFADLTAALTFTPEGLRAVLTIERK